MPFDVMISYNRADATLAHPLCVALKSRGYTVWLDQEQTTTGRTTEAELNQAVKASRFVCAVVTPRYGRTYYTALEVIRVKDREGILAPVRLLPCLFEGELPAFIPGLNYADFRNEAWMSGLEELCRSLTNHTADQDKLSGTAKVVGVAAVVFAAWTLLGNSRTSGREDVVRALLNSVKDRVHVELGRRLRADGRDVPAAKPDRVDAAIRAYGPTPELVAAVVSYPVLRDLCGQAGVSANGKALVLAERVLVALESSSA